MDGKGRGNLGAGARMEPQLCFLVSNARGWLRRRPLPGAVRARSPSAHGVNGLLPDQLVLLLEHLLEQKTVTPRTLQSLERTYRLSEQDAE
ncbi:hypothetical protein Celaphus_00017040, partial [Cervus elaphus hippelaphus]